MFKLLFNGITRILANILSVVMYLPNQLVSAAIPDLTEKINYITQNISQVFDGLTWAVSILPPVLVSTLLFILTLEIAKHTIFTSTHALLKVWNLIQKIKFW